MPARLNDGKRFDVLKDVLETLRFRGSIFFHSDLAAPWGMALAPAAIPRFHIALSGECFVGDDENNEAVRLRAMEIVMLPNGKAHWIADQPGRELVPGDTADEACDLSVPLFQQGTITHRLMCGLVHYDQESPHPILQSLPGILHIAELKADERIWMTVSLIDAAMV